jgi:hypothetical protein
MRTRPRGSGQVNPAMRGILGGKWGSCDGQPCYPALLNSVNRHMPSQQATQEQETGRIVLFPSRPSPHKAKPRRESGQADVHKVAVDDLRKYERGAEPDDYRRRMIINVAAFAFIVVLTLAGIWLAEEFALLQKNQDCAFSGRKNCAHINAIFH